MYYLRTAQLPNHQIVEPSKYQNNSVAQQLNNFTTEHPNNYIIELLN